MGYCWGRGLQAGYVCASDGNNQCANAALFLDLDINTYGTHRLKTLNSLLKDCTSNLFKDIYKVKGQTLKPGSYA